MAEECRLNLTGKCFKGDACKYVHTAPPPASSSLPQPPVRSDSARKSLRPGSGSSSIVKQGAGAANAATAVDDADATPPRSQQRRLCIKHCLSRAPGCKDKGACDAFHPASAAECTEVELKQMRKTVFTRFTKMHLSTGRLLQYGFCRDDLNAELQKFNPHLDGVLALNSRVDQTVNQPPLPSTASTGRERKSDYCFTFCVQQGPCQYGNACSRIHHSLDRNNSADVAPVAMMNSMQAVAIRATRPVHLKKVSYLARCGLTHWSHLSPALQGANPQLESQMQSGPPPPRPSSSSTQAAHQQQQQRVCGGGAEEPSEDDDEFEEEYGDDDQEDEEVEVDFGLAEDGDGVDGEAEDPSEQHARRFNALALTPEESTPEAMSKLPTNLDGVLYCPACTCRHVNKKNKGEASSSSNEVCFYSDKPHFSHHPLPPALLANPPPLFRLLSLPHGGFFGPDRLPFPFHSRDGDSACVAAAALNIRNSSAAAAAAATVAVTAPTTLPTISPIPQQQPPQQQPPAPPMVADADTDTKVEKMKNLCLHHALSLAGCPAYPSSSSRYPPPPPPPGTCACPLLHKESIADCVVYGMNSSLSGRNPPEHFSHLAATLYQRGVQTGDEGLRSSGKAQMEREVKQAVFEFLQTRGPGFTLCGPERLAAFGVTSTDQLPYVLQRSHTALVDFFAWEQKLMDGGGYGGDGGGLSPCFSWYKFAETGKGRSCKDPSSCSRRHGTKATGDPFPLTEEEVANTTCNTCGKRWCNGAAYLQKFHDLICENTNTTTYNGGGRPSFTSGASSGGASSGGTSSGGASSGGASSGGTSSGGASSSLSDLQSYTTNSRAAALEGSGGSSGGGDRGGGGRSGTSSSLAAMVHRADQAKAEEEAARRADQAKHTMMKAALQQRDTSAAAARLASSSSSTTASTTSSTGLVVSSSPSPSSSPPQQHQHPLPLPRPLAPFKLERYFARFEFSAPHLLCCSDCESLGLGELLRFADSEMAHAWSNLSLGYTESRGWPPLLEEIMKQYPDLDFHATTSTSGGGGGGGGGGGEVEEATSLLPLVGAPQECVFLGMHAMLKAGDTVVAMYPGYQSLYEVAISIGCTVLFWCPDYSPTTGAVTFSLSSLRTLIQTHVDGNEGSQGKEDERRIDAIVVNFPHNPTGYLPSALDLGALVEICRSHDAFLFGDEMYRGLELNPSKALPSVVECGYAKAVALSGVSKALSLPGLRIGWLVSTHAPILERAGQLKDFTTICSSAPSEVLATIALRNKRSILAANLSITSKNLILLKDFMNKHHRRFAFAAPIAGTVCFPRLKTKHAKLPKHHRTTTDTAAAPPSTTQVVGRGRGRGGGRGARGGGGPVSHVAEDEDQKQEVVVSDVEDYCVRLVERHGVMLLPATVYIHQQQQAPPGISSSSDHSPSSPPPLPPCFRLGFGRKNLPEVLSVWDAALLQEDAEDEDDDDEESTVFAGNDGSASDKSGN